jgi:hypothetical protein
LTGVKRRFTVGSSRWESEMAERHHGGAGPCEGDHMCPPCIDGGECLDLFTDPECGLVACCTGDADD